MKPLIAAPLTCVCIGCQSLAFASCEPAADASASSAPRMVATSGGPPAPAVRAAVHQGVGAANTTTNAIYPASVVTRTRAAVAPAPAEPPAESPGRRSQTLLAVALALMAGIALRRWGSAGP